jgi:hypothetical protein
MATGAPAADDSRAAIIGHADYERPSRGAESCREPE